jgi:hypothetical protein
LESNSTNDDIEMNLDISTAVQVAFFLAAAGFVLSSILGIRAIGSGRKLKFFRKRRDAMLRGWRLVLIGVFLGALAFSLQSYAEPAIYRVFPPSPTITETPTITLTPTISLTPTITFTPTVTFTPAESPTPQIPPEIEVQFTSVVTPNAAVLFSPLQFTQKIEKNLPVGPTDTFANPVGKLYGTFSYDKMNTGAQWTALWYRLADHQIICSETKPWDGSTGGYGYTECNPSAEQWQPGDYEVQIFVGLVWISSGRFSVTGPASTVTITLTPSRTKIPSSTPIPTHTKTTTAFPSSTFTQSVTPSPSSSLTPSVTPSPYPSLTFTYTPPPTSTMIPSLTPRITDTRLPTPTLTLVK